MQDNLKDLYNSLTADGKVDGSEQEFREIFSNAENLKQLHGALTADGEDYGTEDEFVNMFLPSSTPTQQVNEYAKTIQVPKQKATPKKQGIITKSIYGDQYIKNQQEGYKPQPKAVPSSLYAPESNNKTVLMQNLDAQQNAFYYQQQNTPLAKSIQQQKTKDKPAYTNVPASLSRTVGDEQKIVKDAVKKNVDAAVAAGSKNAISDAVKKTYEELAQQGFDVNTINESGVVGEGVYNAVAPSAEAAAMQGGTDIFKGVFDEAKLKADLISKNALENVQSSLRYGADDSYAGHILMDAERERNKQLDPDKILKSLNEAVDQKGLNATFEQAKVQAEKYGIDPTEYFKTYVAPGMKNRAAQLLDYYTMKEYMPKNDMEYIASGFSDSILGMFTDWYTKSAKQNAYKQQALADYKASTGTEIARRAVGLISSAPEFMVSGGFASAVTKKICGRAITDMVARGFTEAQARNILTAQLASKFGQRLAVSMVHSAVSGAANFGTLDAMSEAMRGVRDDDFSVKNVFDKGIQGASKGIVFGGVTGAYSAATAELTGAKKIISNLLGVPVNGLGLTASENTINLITGAETEDKPFFEQWAENSLTDLMMRATSHHNVSVLTSKGRRELGARIRSTFSGMSDSQKQLGANWRAHGFSEETEAQLKNITGCDNLRDVLEYGVPKATDMPSLPYQGGEVKAKSQSVDDILKAEARKVREQNWDNLMNNRDLPAEVKQQLAAVMNAEYIPNPTVTQTTVTDSQGRKYVEYRDAGGNLNKRVPLADADMSMDAQEKIKNTNAISKMYSLGVSGKAVLAANAMRYASRPDAEGNIPTEEQQVQRQKNFLDRFFKKDLTDMELTELNMDLDKATIMFGGADKIKVITHTDGTASVQYSKNGIPVRTDHYATAEEANKKAYDDKFAQDMSLINALEDPEAVQKYYETQKGMQPGTLAEAVKGYDPADIDRISEQMLQTRDRVDIVTSGDGRARTAEQEELLQQYISWLKDQQKQFEQQPNEFSLTMNAAEQPQYTENYDQQDNHQINLTENDAVADDGKTKQTFATDAEKYKLNEADPQQMQGTETAMPTEQTPQTKPVGAIEAESQRTQSEGTTEVEQPTPIPANIDASTPHGSAYINGKNAVDGNNLPVIYQLHEDYELAKHRIAKFVPSNCPILDDILTMCQTRRFAEAQDLIAATDIPVDQKDALSKFVIAEATQSGMQDAMSDKIKAQQEQAAASIQAKADEQGNVTIVTLDNSNKKAHIVKGDVNNVNGTVMIRDLDANENPVGDSYQISVKQIKSVSDTQRASEMAFNERKRIQQELDAYYAQALNDVSFQPGKKVALKFEGMTIEATVVSENADGTVTFQTEEGETITPRRDEAMQMLSDAKQEGYAIALQYEADAYAKARKEAEEARKHAEEAEAKRIAAEQAAAAERERLKDPVNRLKRDEAGKLDLTNSNPDDVSEFLAKHGAGGKKAAEQELAKVVKAIEELDNEQADTEGLTGIDALLAADEQATEKNARKAELERQQAFWEDQINRIDKREEAVRKEEERKAAEKLKAEQKKQRSLAAFNKPINDARKRMADDPDAMEILDENNREPRTLEEAVADLIPQKGLVLKNWIDGSGVERLGLEGELGMNSRDLKKLTPFIGTVENGATDITTLSERIYENLPESIKNLAPDGNRDVRDAIIKILSEAQTADDIIHFVDNARIREAEAIYSANAAAAEEYERAKAEHTKQVENETAPTYTAAEDPFAGSTGDAPFSFTGIKTPEDVNRHNERARKQGGLILNEESIKLERRTANLLDTIGRQLGRTIEVDPSLMQLGANGQASADGKTLFLSPKVVARGDQMVRFITGHELTHLIKKGDKDIQGVWNDFKKTVQDAMGDEFARIYDEKAKLYKDRIAEIREQSRKTLEDPNASEEAKAEARKYANLRNLSKEQIEEEVICDFIGDKVLTDEEFVKNMIERVEASNADSASICQRMRNFIDKILTYLKSLKNPSSSERKAQEALERAKDIWSDMYELAAAKQREKLSEATNAEEAREAAQSDSFSLVEDKELLDKLDKEKTVTVYRAMQLIDGKLYPPMAAAVDGKMTNPIELGRWEQSDERPDLAVPDIDPKTGKQKTYKDGTPAYKFKLDKGTKDDSGEAQSTIPAGYNPYIHTSRSPLNDQFSSAWKRGHLVTVKVEVPESELTSGYRAEKSKDAVGEVEWKSGGVSGKLAKTGNPRRVILSRYDRPVEIVPTEEVAKSIAKMLEGADIEIPFNVVNSELREALVKEGVKIGEPEKGNAGKAAIPAYEEWKAGQNNGMVSEPRMDVETEKILSPVTEVDAPSNIGLNNGTLSAEGNARMELYSNMELADAREDIRSVAKIFNGKIGNASAGAFNYEKEGSEDTIHSVADAKKAGQIGRAMTIALEDYKNRLQEVGAKYEGVRKKVFDDAIADVDKAIKWYTEFANGEHQKIGEHADDGIKFSFTIPQNEEEYKKKETAWHTVMKETVAARHAQAPDQSENAKPLSAAKVQKIENITKSLEGIISSVNKKSIERNDFLNWISGAIGFRNGEKDKSKYGTAITLGNGDEVYMRVSNHSGRMINFELYRQNDKDSYGIVVNSSVDELDGYRPRFKDKNNVDHLELQYYTERFDDATENQRQALELGIAEGIKHLISTGSFEKMPLPNDVNPSGIYKRIFNEVKKRIEQENEINFSFEDLEQDKTLAGVHNLTMDKLRKAMRLGGLANPSVAIVDREKHAHDEFGDVSLILPSNLIDSRTGRNAGTWTHDVWTPTYPKSRTVFTSEGRKSFVNMLDNSGIDEGIRGKLMDEIDQMQFGSQPNLAYLYLKSRGIDATEYKHPDLTSDWVDIFRKHKTADKLLEAMKADENLAKKVNGATQHYFEVKFATEHPEQHIVAELNGEPGALIKAIRANRENMRKTYGVVDGKFSEEQIREAFDEYKKKFRSKKHGVDDYWSVQNAYYDVYNRGWFEDYENWLDKTLNEHGVKTELHAGVDRNGNSKYVPDTVQNASRIMNESQKQTGGGSFGGWGTFIAQMAKHMKTLSDIRERKSMLGNEDNNEDVKYVRENFSQFPTMLNEKNPDFDLWDGSASKAFADLLKHIGKVQVYAKRKYGIDLSEGEVESLKEYYKAFKRMPIDYFETKFDRPVSLNEFVSAVVPKNAPSDIVEALEKSGLQVFKYNPKKEGDREKVSRKAMSDDRVSFSFEEEQQKSPEFKAWFGDWENDPENASKVVNKKGEPLVVYHGTLADNLTRFDPEMIGSRYSYDEKGFFFTSHENIANDYASSEFDKDRKGKIIPVYLNLRKPLIVDKDWCLKNGLGNPLKDMDAIEFWDNYQSLMIDESERNDGIIIDDGQTQMYVAFKPNQIKSATENNGEFSKENDDIRFSFLTEKTPEQFDELHKLAVENTGYVPVGIEKREVKVVSLDRHPFSGSGKQALDKARTWASKNIVGVHVANEGTPEEYRYNISEDAIDKFLSSSSTKHSYNLGLHLATLMKLPEIIENSIDAEIHPDYNKVSGNRSASNGVGNKDMLVHRLYGAAELEDTTYRVKNTVKEIRGGANDAYNYEITKVELPISGSAASDALGNSTFIMGAKLLENVEKSYEKGEKLLAVSMKNAETAKLTSQSDEHTDDNTSFSFEIPEGKTKQQMQAETDADIARQMNTVREGDTLSDVVRKATAIHESDKLVKLHRTISDNLIKSGDNFEDVLRKAEALKAASAEVDSFAFSREERAHRAYEREKKRQEKAINDAQKALRKKVVDEINFLMNDKHLTVFNKSALSKMLKDVQNADTNNIQEILTSVRTEVDRLTDKSQQRQIEDLMKLKTQDQNGKGMSIAKNVSDSVRRTLDMIRGRIVDLKATGYEEDMTQLRRQNIFINGENKRLENQIYRLKHEDPTDERTQQQIDAEIAEAEAKIAENLQKKEANLSELAELKVKKQEAETAKALKADADVTEEINDLMKKMDDHVAGNATWTLSDSEKLTGLQILKMKQDADTTRRDISKLQSQLAELEESLASHRREARRPQRYVPVQRMEQLEQQIAGMKAAIEQATKNLIGQNGSIIDIIKNMIEEGKDSLLNQVENEKNRKFELLHDMLGDIQGKKNIPTDIKEQAETHNESRIKKFFAAQLHSFEYLAKRINENTLGEDGWFYNYFVKGKNGVMQAESNHQQGLREAVATLDEKAQEIYGMKFAEAAKEAATVENHPGVFLQHEQNGMIVEEEIPLSKSQAMYLYMVWKMPDGKMKLQLQGFTDETMGQIREFLDEKDVNYADWIQDEFLKDQRAKYNDLYVELYHTSMANIDNYVPLKIVQDDVQKDANLSEDSAKRKTLEERAGSLINRRFNTHRVNWTMGAFDVIAEHVNQMEEWNAFARVRKDLDYILSNTYVRNQLDANSAGRFNQLYDASAIAAHAYMPDKAKYMDDVVGWLTKGLVGGNIAYRYTTAMKQILSVPAFYGYSQDPRYLIALTKNIGYQYTWNSPAVIANMITCGFSGKNGFKLADEGKRKSLLSENIMWCLKNVPSFRNRVLKGTSGLEYMDEKLKGKIGQWVDKYLDYGMATNQMIDAITCSIGIKSIYDYKYGKLAKAIEADTSLSPEEKEQQLEEARRAAIMDADIYYNATQQSNHAAFMAPMQLSRSMIDRALSVYQNASIGYARRAANAGENLLKMSTPAKWRRLQSEYATQLMNENEGMNRHEAMEQASAYLKRQALHNSVGVALYGIALNWLWDWGGRGLLGFFQEDDDDKENRRRAEAGLENNKALDAAEVAGKIAEWSSYPLRGLTGMNISSAVINGNLSHPLLFWSELDEQQQRAKKYWTDEDYAAIASQALFKGLRIAGFDARVWYNITAGTAGLMKSSVTGNPDSDLMIDLMLALNTPNSNRRQVAETLYRDYDRDTYVRNIMHAAKYTDNEYMALLPGMKLLTAKNELEIYKEFELNHLSADEFAKLKSEQKEMLKHLKSVDDLQNAYNEEKDPVTKNAIGRKLIQVMKAEQPKTASTADELAKKAKENLLVKDVKNTSYISLCNSNDLIEDEMLKELKAEYKPVMNNFDELKYDSPSAAEEYAKQNEADTTKYKELDKYMTKIAQLKGKMEKMKNSDTLQILMDTIRSVRNQALGKKKQ